MQDLFKSISYNREEVGYPDVLALMKTRKAIPRIFSYRVFFTIYSKMVTIFVKSKIENMSENIDRVNQKPFFAEIIANSVMMTIDRHLFTQLIMVMGIYVPFPKAALSIIERIDAFVDYLTDGYREVC